MANFSWIANAITRRLTTPRRDAPTAPFHGLVRRILWAKPGGNGRPVIGVTACASGDGATTTALNAAVSSASDLKLPTLLIEANFDRPALEAMWQLNPGPGLSDVLAGQRSLDECIQRSDLEEFRFMGPGEGSASDAFNDRTAWPRLLENLRKRFALVFIDLPSVPQLMMQPTLAEISDGLLLVVHAERTRSAAAARLRQQLDQLNARLFGVVLNRRKLHIPRWIYQRV
jgi:Mrp family chromosome partitioning ATPase